MPNKRSYNVDSRRTVSVITLPLIRLGCTGWQDLAGGACASTLVANETRFMQLLNTPLLTVQYQFKYSGHCVHFVTANIT